jgi:hypothetical protein
LNHVFRRQSRGPRPSGLDIDHDLPLSASIRSRSGQTRYRERPYQPHERGTPELSIGMVGLVGNRGHRWARPWRLALMGWAKAPASLSMA